MNLPQDLTDYLKQRRQLEYDAAECEAGSITLLPLARLQIKLFPTDVDNGPIDNNDDPHCGEMGCYLIPAVSLAEECENFDAEGLLLWLPEESCFGTWDADHTLVEVFSPSVKWSDIADDPLSYVNSFWSDDRAGGLAPLVPWPKYEYDPDQPTAPLPLRP
jgi:hypothetical protein